LGHAEKRTGISGTLYVTAKIGAKSITAPAVMLVRWPDKFRLEAQDPVGGTLMLLVVNGSEFWLYQKGRPEILTGQLKFLPAPLRMITGGKDIVRAFLARPPLEEWKNPVLSGREARPRAAPDLGAVRPAKVSWDGRQLEPEVWEQTLSNGGKSVFEYDDYATHAGVSFPEKIRVTHTDPDDISQASTFAWRDWQPNVPEEKKLFQIPQQQRFGRKIKALH
jgi:hypothetical protein